jgi:hypothetical protein
VSAVQAPHRLGLIYVLDYNYSLIVAPEIPDPARSGVSGGVRRATHSQLAHGLPVFAAGVLTFEAHQPQGPWHLVQISNGSGHYMPHYRSLPLMQQLLSGGGDYSLEFFLNSRYPLKVRDEVAEGKPLFS